MESVEPLGGGPADEWRLRVRHANLVIDDADAGFLKCIAAIDQLAAANGGFTKLLAAWARAERFYLLAAESDGRRRALLAYAQIMEAVGKLVAADVGPGPEAQAEAEGVVADLLKTLQQQPGVDAAKSAIRDSRVRLDRIDITTEGQRMRKAGEVIGMEAASRKAGEELWRLRSKKAGHDAAEPVTNDELVFARKVADEYFRRYVDWRITISTGSANPESAS